MKQVNTRRDCSSRVGGEVLAGRPRPLPRWPAASPAGQVRGHPSGPVTCAARPAGSARRARSPHLRLVIGRSAPPPLAKDDSRAGHVQVHRPRSVTAAMADPDHLPVLLSSSSIGSARVLYRAALRGHGAAAPAPAAAPAAAPACAAGHAFSGRLSALLSPGVAAQRQWCPAATSITGLMYSRVLKPRAAARRKAARVTTAAAAVPALLASCPVFVLVLFASRAFQYEARGRRADPAQVVANCRRSV
ncbi:uncharacterized protein LOC126485059 [Schistocerca serialis cubense]|uniref:uncharacterized protein LOC126485059 n=1 Tax=Schistocerca serialis cubense TaxID=2023355 RepID=UPI00214F514D|nr:uncharacterized protein LOC126485059 [Schistocerca serialis cubense]